MRRVASRPACVLLRYGCVRPAWDSETAEEAHPAHKVVDADRNLRAEDI